MPRYSSHAHAHAHPHHHQRSLFKLPTLTSSVSIVGEQIPQYIPGFRASATFLSSLSANLQFQEDFLFGTPTSSSPSSICSVSETNLLIPSSFSMAPTQDTTLVDANAATDSNELVESLDPLEGVPELGTYVATSEADRIAGLKLVADSIAQQRQIASQSIIWSAAFWSVIVATIAILIRLQVKNYRDLGEWAIFGTTFAGVMMTLLVSVRMSVGPYLEQAESIANWAWLGDDDVIVTKFGDLVIGGLVLGFDDGKPKVEEEEGTDDKKKDKKKAKSTTKSDKKKWKGGKAVVRGWSVLLRYRRKGEGKMLLREAINISKDRGAETLVFETNGIYSKRILPSHFNGEFDKRDRQAAASLKKALDEHWGQKK